MGDPLTDPFLDPLTDPPIDPFDLDPFITALALLVRSTGFGEALCRSLGGGAHDV